MIATEVRHNDQANPWVVHIDDLLGCMPTLSPRAVVQCAGLSLVSLCFSCGIFFLPHSGSPRLILLNVYRLTLIVERSFM